MPKGWEWVRLEDIGHDWGQTTPKSEFTYIDVGAINKELGLIENPQIIQPENAPSRARKIVKKGTVIYSTVRPYLLNIAVVNDDFFPEPIASTAFAIIHPYSGISASFVYRYLRSPSFISYVESCQTGIAYPAVNDKQFFSGLIPLPPESEQHRIVAKVDELMQLCDQLEQKQNDSQQTHRQLVSTLLTTLTEARDAQAFQAAWSRIAANFDALFTTLSSVEQLQQTILQLAVMGKLVPQNPDDEPASELLKKIAEEKTRLIAEGKIKKSAPLPKISETEMPFVLPDNWEWVRLGSISELVNGDRGKNYPNRDEYVSDGIPFINTGHINPDGSLDALSMNFITREKFNSLNSGKIQKGDILYCLRGATMGKTAFVNQYKEGAIASSLVIIRLDKVLTEKYAYIFLISPYGKKLIKQYDNGSAQPNLSGNSVTLYISPVPPLAEQHRIVAKVDELMTLCEHLKTKLQTAQTLQQQLAQTLVQQAVA